MSEEKVPTGIKGLNDILNGGIPRGSLALVLGGPGVGKTILATQFLVNGINEFKENGIFATLLENPIRLKENMAKFGWNLGELEKSEKFRFIDASPTAPPPITRLSGEIRLGMISIGRREFSMISLIEAIQSAVEEINAKRIVLDSMASLIFQYADLTQRRKAILDLFESLISSKATCLVTQEQRNLGLERGIQDEEYLADGVIIMQRYQVGKILLRAIQIEKMKRSEIDDQPRPYKITDKGIAVFPKEVVF